MGVLGQGGINNVLGVCFGQTVSPVPEFYVACLVSGTEVSFSGLGYARAVLGNTSTEWGAVSGSLVSNIVAVTFDEATGDWGSITSVNLYTDPTSTAAADLYLSQALTTPQTVNTGQTAQIEANVIQIGCS